VLLKLPGRRFWEAVSVGENQETELLWDALLFEQIKSGRTKGMNRAKKWHRERKVWFANEVWGGITILRGKNLKGGPKNSLRSAIL